MSTCERFRMIRRALLIRYQLTRTPQSFMVARSVRMRARRLVAPPCLQRRRRTSATTPEYFIKYTNYDYGRPNDLINDAGKSDEIRTCNKVFAGRCVFVLRELDSVCE